VNNAVGVYQRLGDPPVGGQAADESPQRAGVGLVEVPEAERVELVSAVACLAAERSRLDGPAVPAPLRVPEGVPRRREKPVRGREYFDAPCLALILALILDVADSWLVAADKRPEAIENAGVATVWLQEELFAA
jgi:hypothetical protein